MRTLRHLNLSGLLRDSGPNGLPLLADLPALQNLDLSCCSNAYVSADALQALIPLRGLQELNLDGRQLNQVLSTLNNEGLACIAGLTTLRRLSLSRCHRLSDRGMASLKPLRSLQSLDLWGCGNIRDVGVAHLTGLLALQSLNLGQTGMERASLASLSALQKLALPSDSPITQKELSALSRLQALQSLVMDPSQVKTLPAGFKALCRLSLTQTPAASFLDSLAGNHTLRELSMMIENRDDSSPA